MEKLNLKQGNLRKFGITMCIAFLVITMLIFLKSRRLALSTSVISIAFLAFSFGLTGILKPVYIFWMRLAFILGWINTRLILCIMYYLVFVPISLIMRLCGVDLLERKIEKNKGSYWKEKEKKEFSPLDYERQF